MKREFRPDLCSRLEQTGRRLILSTYRERTREIRIGNRFIGGGNPITVQSMTNTPTEDADATIAQILRLEEAGCEIIRSTVPTLEAAEAPLDGADFGGSGGIFQDQKEYPHSDRRGYPL